jgi:transcriptional regulator with XRE-family HTH domain
MTARANFGRHIRHWRQREHHRQRDLADRMREHGHPWYDSTVSLVEAGHRNITIDELAALAFILRQRPVDLLAPIDPETIP